MAPPPNRKPPDEKAAEAARNEYIPSFISKKPFYVVEDDSTATTSAADYLEHQRLHTTSEEKSRWYDRGRKTGPAATKYRKGACENCGAMTHKTKECLERPRKQGAKWTGKDIAADEVVQDVNLGWDAKRDRWNGYDASEYQNVVEEYNALEDMKKQLKGEAEDAAANDGDKYEEETDMGRQQSTATRNLRLREDTAKYLINLDLDSAKYDPKTRAMIDAGSTDDQAAALVAEEGFMRASGDAAEFEKAQKLAWESQERGDKNKVHLQANPTAGEYWRKKEEAEAAAKRDAQKKLLLEKYGSQEHLHKNVAKDAIVESDRYVEYDNKGKIKGAAKIKAKSQYAEDVLIGNHTSVWGSWWKDFKWGYQCCHSTVKNSYCTGEDGRRAAEETERLMLEGPSQEITKEEAWHEEAALEEHVPNATEHDAKAKLDSEKRAKRTLDEMRNGIDDADMEEYMRKRISANDPMAKHLGKDELVH
ncbi:hypothetical protein MRB53_042041 [Persea americana]|nr:hypothetical protein MRB53_042041 [Persea americana]